MITEKRFVEKIDRLKALEGPYTRAKKALESGEAAEMKLLAFDRIAALITRAGTTDASLLLGQITEAVERTTEPGRIVKAYEALKASAASISKVVVDDDARPTN